MREGEGMNMLTIIVIGRLACALASILVAGYLAMRGLNGWGWFLFIGLILGSITGSSSDKKMEGV